MNKITVAFIMILAVLGFSVVAMGQEPAHSNQAASLVQQETIILSIDNMTCAVCPITVKKALMKVAGVSGVEVNFKNKTATVTFDPEMTSTADLMTATKNSGYPSRLK